MGHKQTCLAVASMSASPPTADIGARLQGVSKVPCVDGSGLARAFFTSQAGSVLPCVRPLDAVHMTAGHNALRGSGPGQKPAFDDAMALVGCPDRRIDRLCITCCLPSQPLRHAGCPARSRLSRKRDGFLISLASGHHSPDHSRDLVGERDVVKSFSMSHVMTGGGGVANISGTTRALSSSTVCKSSGRLLNSPGGS